MICLGYLSVRPDPIKSHPYRAALSLCDDYCDRLLGCWCLDWVASSTPPEWFPAAEVPAIRHEGTQAFGSSWEWPGIATDLQWLRSIHDRWGTPHGCRLVAIGCEADMVETVIAASAPPPREPQYAPMGALGHHLMARRRIAVDDSWRLIGWEVLEVNPFVIADCHTDSALADPITGLMATRQMAMNLAETLTADNQHGRLLNPLPIAIFDIVTGSP